MSLLMEFQNGTPGNSSVAQSTAQDHCFWVGRLQDSPCEQAHLMEQPRLYNNKHTLCAGIDISLLEYWCDMFHSTTLHFAQLLFNTSHLTSHLKVYIYPHHLEALIPQINEISQKTFFFLPIYLLTNKVVKKGASSNVMNAWQQSTTFLQQLNSKKLVQCLLSSYTW